MNELKTVIQEHRKTLLIWVLINDLEDIDSVDPDYNTWLGIELGHA